MDKDKSFDNKLELLPCPFCGGQPQTWWDIERPDPPECYYNEGYNIKCCIVELCRIHKSEAIEAWNERITV